MAAVPGAVLMCSCGFLQVTLPLLVCKFFNIFSNWFHKRFCSLMIGRAIAKPRSSIPGASLIKDGDCVGKGTRSEV